MDTDTKNKKELVIFQTCQEHPRTSSWGYTAIPCCTPIHVDAEIRIFLPKNVLGDVSIMVNGTRTNQEFLELLQQGHFFDGNLHRIFTSMTKQPFPIVCVCLVSRTGMDMRILVYRIDIAKEPQP
jgi:hypothetical protein